MIIAKRKKKVKKLLLIFLVILAAILLFTFIRHRIMLAQEMDIVKPFSYFSMCVYFLAMIRPPMVPVIP